MTNNLNIATIERLEKIRTCNDMVSLFNEPSRRKAILGELENSLTAERKLISEVAFFKKNRTTLNNWLSSSTLSFWKRWCFFSQVDMPSSKTFSSNTISLLDMLPVNPHTAPLRLAMCNLVTTQGVKNNFTEQIDAFLTLHLGYSYLGLRNEKKALTFLIKALAQFKEQQAAETIAKIYSALAILYRGLKGKGTVNNIKTSIKYSRKALALYDKLDKPLEKAKSLAQIGIALAADKSEDEQQNKKMALPYLNAALAIPEFTKNPSCAHAHQAIGNITKVLSGMTGKDFYKEAIAAFKTAEKIFHEQQDLFNCALAKGNIGATYILRQENRSKNLEKAKKHFEEGLSLLESFPHGPEWAQMKGELGNLYSIRIKGDPRLNLIRAKSHLQEALEVLNPNTHHFHWATVACYLSNTYRKLDNFNASAKWLEKAVVVYKKQNMPLSVGRALISLGHIYAAQIHRNNNKEKTIFLKAKTAYIEANSLLFKKGLERLCATALFSLGFVYYLRAKLCREQTKLFKALACFKKAYSLLVNLDSPQDLANLKYYWALTVRELPENCLKNLESAAMLLHEALLCIASIDFNPRAVRDYTIRLGEIYIELYHHNKTNPNKNDYLISATKAFEKAEKADQLILDEAIIERSIKHEFNLGTCLYFDASWCLAKLGRAIESLNWLEKGKSRGLREVVAAKRLDPKIRQKCEELNEKIRVLRSEQNITNFKANELRETLKERNRLVSDFFKGFFPGTITFKKIASCLQDDTTAIVEYNVTEWGTTVFLIFKNEDFLEIKTIFVDDFTLDDLNNLTVTWLENYNEFKNIKDKDLTEDDISKWNDHIEKLIHNSNISNILPPAITLEIKNWKATSYILIPHLSLHLFPLHLFTEKAKKWNEVSVSYAPSLTILVNIKAEHIKYRDNFLGIAGIREGVETNEVEKSSSFFNDPKVLQATALNVSCLFAELKDYGYIHLSCHGKFNMESPYESYLSLNQDEPEINKLSRVAYGKKIKLIDIFTTVSLEKTRMVVLSACESGVSDVPEGTDELLGFPAGFLYAGAPSVVSTLWKVDIKATELFMETFYENIKNGRAISEALKQAQLTLKGNLKYTEPYFWGAFYLTGNPQ